MIESINFDNVDATLHGQIISNKAWKGLVIGFYVVIGLIFTICATCFIIIELTNKNYDMNDLIGIICPCVTSAIFLIGVICFHRFLYMQKKKVNMWLEDAILLKAQTVSIGERLRACNIPVVEEVALEVTFVYNGMRVERQSTYNNNPLYLPVYRKYANREITIAYSPKYDEVILIKPESVKE